MDPSTFQMEDGFPFSVNSNYYLILYLLIITILHALQDVGPTNLLVQKLTSIHDSLLQRHDPPLYNHLARLEIPPQIYGMLVFCHGLLLAPKTVA